MKFGIINRQMRVKRVDTEQRSVDAVMSTDTVDRYGEVVDPKAFRDLLPRFMENPVLLADHDHTKQIGHWRNVRVTSRGLEGTAIFADTEKAEEHWKLYRDGHRKAFSVGFIAHSDTFEQRKVEGEMRRVRVFDKVELVECSSVAIPANTDALVVMGFDGMHHRGRRLGARIQARREELDMTQEELGRRIGRDTSTVGQIESGEIIRPPDEVLRRLADALDLSFRGLQQLADSDQESQGGQSGDESHENMIRRIVQQELENHNRELEGQMSRWIADALDQVAGREAHDRLFDRQGDDGGDPTVDPNVARQLADANKLFNKNQG